MNPNPITVPSYITLQEFVDKYVYHYHYKMFPVVDGSRVVGVITTQAVKTVPNEEWHHLQVGGLMQPQSPDDSVDPDTPVKEALSKMSGSGLSRLLVLEHGKMVGIVTLKDLLEFLALKMELET